MNNISLIDMLHAQKRLTQAQWTQLIATHTDADREYARALAQSIAIARFGRDIFFRGIIEFTNFCKNNCYYCGIRAGNAALTRYRLADEDILRCCAEAYACGMRTFVLQGGEDAAFTDARLCALVRRIKAAYPDCAVTLSVGERSRASYALLREEGADRYLLRHETADSAHYALLHPPAQTLENRMRCLRDLRALGYQVGAGMMVGSPHQRPEHLARDMAFLGEFRPEMVGVGPFIPHSATPFAGERAGSVELTLMLVSLIRIMLPRVLLPATTALGTAQADGRQLGVLAGCNVVMPNVSPAQVRKKYMLYDNKSGTELTAAQSFALLDAQMRAIGYGVRVGRGDYAQDASRTEG